MNIIIREEAEFITEPKQVTLKEQEYFEYITEHIKNVQDSYQELFINQLDKIHIESVPDTELHKAIEDVKADIACHDNSKFSDDEFYGYRIKYYPTQEEQYKLDNDETYRNFVEEKSNDAWMHHIKCNDHHSEHWKTDIDGNYNEDITPRDMELKCIIHMICDWEAMSKKFKTDTIKWYQDQFEKDEKHISITTRKIIEELLEVAFGRV